MGYNSVVFICNDAIHEIEKDAEGWWRKAWLKLCMLATGETEDFGHGNHANGFEAVWNQHADLTGVIMVGQNHATVIDYSLNKMHHTEEGQLAILKEILERRGYYVRKKPQRKT